MKMRQFALAWMGIMLKPSKNSNHNHNNDHDHDHDDHSHHDGHHHHHHHIDIKSHADISKAFIVGGVLNLIFVIFELVFGFLTGSVSLIADAVHNFSDVVALFLSWIGFKLNQTKPSAQFTYGLKKMSLIITFFNSVTLIISLIYILYEAYQRFITPQPLSENTIIAVAGLGIVVNFLSAFLFRRNQHDVNVKGAYLHLMMDAFISLGVVVAGLGIKFTGWNVLDPVVACLIVVFIAKGAGQLLRESFVLLVGGVPLKIDLENVRKEILANSTIEEIHDLHVWSLGSSDIALTAHVKVKDKKHPGDNFLHTMSSMLKKKFDISHVTIQIEIGDTNEAVCTLDGKC